jgi:hypothetical protein
MSDDATIALEPLNDFDLSGAGTRIHYATSGFDGRPRLRYEGPAAAAPREFSGDDIEARASALGTEVTVALDLVLDGDNHTLTLVLPAFRSNGGEERFATIAVVTTNKGSLVGPPRGARQRYDVVELEGVARAVDF